MVDGVYIPWAFRSGMCWLTARVPGRCYSLKGRSVSFQLSPIELDVWFGGSGDERDEILERLTLGRTEQPRHDEMK